MNGPLAKSGGRGANRRKDNTGRGTKSAGDIQKKRAEVLERAGGGICNMGRQNTKLE